MRTVHSLCALALFGSLGCGEKLSLPSLRENAMRAQSISNLSQHGVAKQAAEAAIGRRKIVYNADVELLVEELTAAETTLQELIKTHKAILADSEVTSYPGSPRVGVWRVRVPADEFEAFLKTVSKLGEVQRSRTDTQDVTREYSDLEEQIKNLRAEAEGLRELLKRPTEKLADTLAIREQLSKVTRELDGLVVRVKRMESLVDYSTVTLSIREHKDYLPPESPTLTTSMARTFQGSVGSLVSFLRGTLLVAVAIVPWLPVVGLVGIPSGWLVRRRRRAA